jgi:UDP-glucose 4-epimerase
VRNAPSNYLRLERPFALLGFDPPLQFIHERDLVRAIRLSLQKDRRGIFNLRGPGELTLSNALQVLGRSPVILPSFVAQGVVRGIWSSRAAKYHPGEIEYLRYVCMVNDSRARSELQYQPGFTIEETLNAIFLDF